MKQIDLVKTIKDSGFTKRDFAKFLKVSRPTLDKNIHQFEKEFDCGNMKLKILFSRFTFHDHLSKTQFMKEYEYTINAIAEIGKFQSQFFYQYEDKSLINQDAESNILDHVNEFMISSLNEIEFADKRCPSCNVTNGLFQRGPNGKIYCRACGDVIDPLHFTDAKSNQEKSLEDASSKQSFIHMSLSDFRETYNDETHKINDEVKCIITRKLDKSYLVEFNRTKGAIKFEDMSQEINNLSNPVGIVIDAILISAKGKRHDLIMK